MQERLTSEHRRTEILQEALHILFELGSHGLTMRNLAERVGLSEAALYRHFRGKEDIVQNLTDLACDSLPAQGLGTTGPLDLLEELMYRQLRKLSTTPHLTAIVFEEELFREYPAVRTKLQQCRRDKEKLIISLVQEGQTLGEFDPRVKADVFALLFMGSIRMAVLKWQESDFAYCLVEQGERTMVEFTRFLKGE